MRTMLIAVVTVLGVGAAVLGPAAVAAPAVSPFVGEYTGQAVEPFESWQTVWGSISISSSGRIAGTKPDVWTGNGKFAGSVGADGQYSLSGSYQWRWPRNWISDFLPGVVVIDASAAKDSAVAETSYFQSAGTLVRGTDGNLYGTTTSGATFVWTRK